MSIESMYRMNLAILRRAPTMAVDDDNLPVYASPSTIATVKGQIQPVSLKEQADLADTGAVYGDYRAYLDPTDVKASDQIQNVDTGQVFQVRAVYDAAGHGHHLETVLWSGQD